MSFEARAKPFGRVDYTKTTEGIVKFKLPGKNFGQRLVALVIIDNQNRVDANAGVALLRENGSAWSERRTQDMAEAEDFIVGQLACKGQYKIRGKLRTPATSEKGDQGRGTVKGLADTSLEGADDGGGIPMWALEGTCGGITRDHELCCGDRAGMWSRGFGRVSRHRRCGQGSLMLKGVFIGNFHCKFASIASSHASFEPCLIGSDKLITCHVVKLRVGEICGLVSSLDRRRIGRFWFVRVVGCGSKTVQFVTLSHDRPWERRRGSNWGSCHGRVVDGADRGLQGCTIQREQCDRTRSVFRLSCRLGSNLRGLGGLRRFGERVASSCDDGEVFRTECPEFWDLEIQERIPCLMAAVPAEKGPDTWKGSSFGGLCVSEELGKWDSNMNAI